jgi:hypothetical protein
MIPKSLHTVSVLVNVAQHHMAIVRHQYPQGNCTPAAAIDAAAAILGYADTADVYALKAAAVRKLEKAQRS